MKLLLALVVVALVAVQEAQGLPFLCGVCKEAVGKLEKIGADKINVGDVTKERDKACKKTGPFEHVCEHEANKLATGIVKALKDGKGASEVCDLVHAC